MIIVATPQLNRKVAPSQQCILTRRISQGFCCWNLINTLKESFVLDIQRSKKMEECELIAYLAFVHMNPQVFTSEGPS